ncbi:MAG: alpha-2-macroglobulin, partial [Planctomycetes bacterium]|nr:alpha-2-macroglobulin [Planctomycetota bacterium]
VVRKNFADTAYWNAFVVTGADGKATVEFDMPDSLTTWRATARGIDATTRVGATAVEVVTAKTLMVRLQAPRFFRERDELLLSAIVNNQGKVEELVKATLKLEGGTLELADKDTFEIKVSANGEARVDWKVKATKEGLAKITVTGIGQQDSDAMMMEFPVYVHGMDKMQGWSGVVKGDTETSTIEIMVPADRKVSTADLVVQVSPTMMGAILDALPYLIEYPYGCVEQTMSRFMPAVSVAQTLKQSGVSLEEIGKRRRLAYADLPPAKDPVFHTAALEHIVEQGLQRLYSFQNGAGGWGWWQSDTIDPFITAYVVNGLRIAKAAGAPVDEGRFQNAVNALKRNLEKEQDLHRAAYCAYVLAECKALDKKPADHLYDRRGDMNSYGRALLAMAMHLAGQKDKAEVCIRNMEDFVKVDEKNGLAWWDREDRWAWWYWYGDDVEANSAILRAYIMVDGKNPNVERVAKWLLMNRDGVRWKSTRDTAHAVLALCEYAKASGELSPEYTADIELDGKLLKSFGVTGENVFTLHGETGLKGDAIETGKHTITVKKSGKGTAYWSVYLKYFTTEEDLKAGSSKMDVARAYYRLHAKKVETNEGGRKVTRIEYDREALASGAKVTSGDLLEIELTIDAPNDYEYLVFEDFKAAGTEPTELVSGPVWGTIASNKELRDEKVVYFVSWLPKGKHKLSYRVRAEIPGSFHAMPTNGYAMYAPSVRAISDEFRLVIEDKPVGEDGR